MQDYAELHKLGAGSPARENNARAQVTSWHGVQMQS